MGKRDSNGRFKRLHKVWDSSRWNDGYIDNRGRFRVYRPDYPNCYSEGYALRSHVVWWLNTNVVCTNKTQLHHKDENKLNDSIKNLILVSRSEHQKIHKGTDTKVSCLNCSSTFIVTFWKSQFQKFCSKKCYHLFPRTKSHKKAISEGLKLSHLKRKG